MNVITTITKQNAAAIAKRTSRMSSGSNNWFAVMVAHHANPNSAPVAASTIKYRPVNVAPHARHFPRSQSQLMSGRLSNQRIGFLQAKQCDGGFTTERPFGCSSDGGH